MTAANLIRLAAMVALKTTGARRLRTAPLPSEECASFHNFGPRIGKLEPGVPHGTPGVTAPWESRQLAESGAYLQRQALTPARLWTSVHRSDRLSAALRRFEQVSPGVFVTRAAGSALPAPQRTSKPGLPFRGTAGSIARNVRWPKCGRSGHQTSERELWLSQS
jgi:hypothetical protein